MQFRFGASKFVGFAVFTFLAGPAAVHVAAADAPNAQVVRRLEEFGRMPRARATRLAKAIDDALEDNARRGGRDYDGIRQSIGQALYGSGADGGPGRNPQERTERLGRVLSILSSGLDAQSLEALFASKPGAALACAANFGVSMSECDALIAAADQEQAALPYAPPDEGADLARELVNSGVSARVAAEVADGIYQALLSVPTSLTRDAKGRAIGELLSVCPGGLESRESQVRAWHVGATAGLTRCVVASLLDRGPEGLQIAQTVFGFDNTESRIIANWTRGVSNSPAAVAERAPSPTTRRAAGPDIEDVLSNARASLQAGNFPQAATQFRTATQLEPGRLSAWTGLATAYLRGERYDDALATLEQARQIDSGAASVFVLMGQAFGGAGNLQRADAAFREALRLEPRNNEARAGLTRLASLNNTTGRSAVEPVAAQGRPTQRTEQQPNARQQNQRPQQNAAAQRTAAAGPVAQAAPTVGQWLTRARDLFQQGQFAQAASAYENVVRLEPTSVSYQVDLARARAQAGNTEGAVAALQAVLSLDPQNSDAREGLAHLRPGSVVPEQPSRETILNEMRRLTVALNGCAPNTNAIVKFKVTVASTGMVSEAALQGGDAETAEAECMAGVVRSARFPAFSKDHIEFVYPFKVGNPGAAGSATQEEDAPAPQSETIAEETTETRRAEDEALLDAVPTGGRRAPVAPAAQAPATQAPAAQAPATQAPAAQAPATQAPAAQAPATQTPAPPATQTPAAPAPPPQR